jgi:6-phosphofructokinase
MGRRRIGILTGGSDVPGLNSLIQSAVDRATDHGPDIPEHSADLERLTVLLAAERKEHPSHVAAVVLSEGAAPPAARVGA